MAVKNRRDGKLTIVDGTSPTPVETVVEFMESDFTWNEPVANDPIPIKTRKAGWFGVTYNPKSSIRGGRS